MDSVDLIAEEYKGTGVRVRPDAIFSYGSRGENHDANREIPVAVRYTVSIALIQSLTSSFNVSGST